MCGLLVKHRPNLEPLLQRLPRESGSVLTCVCCRHGDCSPSQSASILFVSGELCGWCVHHGGEDTPFLPATAIDTEDGHRSLSLFIVVSTLNRRYQHWCNPFRLKKANSSSCSFLNPFSAETVLIPQNLILRYKDSRPTERIDDEIDDDLKLKR